MYAVGRLGSFLSRGVYTVSGPFHPFGGAVDIIVVEQQDGSFKSSPWYVRFGKFQGVLKTKEKVVDMSVNGVEANFHMYLDHKGEAYFLREVDVEDGDSVLSPLSSGEETDGQTSSSRPMKSRNCNYGANQLKSVNQTDVSNGKIVARTNSRRSRILGLVFGRKSMKEDRFREEEDGAGVVRANSLERAEIAADLLEVNWSTKFASGRRRKDNASRFSASDISDGEAVKDLQISDGHGKVDSLVHDSTVNSLAGYPNHEMGYNSQPSFQQHERSVEETGIEMSCLITDYDIGTSTFGESGLENNELNSETSRKMEKLRTADDDENVKGVISEIASHDSQILDSMQLEACPSKKLDKEQICNEKDVGLTDGVDSKEENGAERLQSFIYCETSESLRIGLDGFGEQANETLCLSCGECGEVCVHAETLHNTTELISEVNSQRETGFMVAKEPLNIQGFIGEENCCNFFNDANILESEGTSSNSMMDSVVTETYSQMVAIHPINGPLNEVESQSILTISSFSNSICGVQDEKNIREDFSGVCVPTEAINISPSEGSEEEQLFFGDLDDFKLSEVEYMESVSPDHVENEIHPSLSPRGIEAVNESFCSNYESNSFPDKFVQDNLPNDVEDLRGKSKIKSSDINIPRSSKIVGEEVGRMIKSLPSIRSDIDDLDTHDLHHSSGHSLDSNFKSSKWTLPREDVSSCIKSDADNEHQLFHAQPSEDAKISEELKNIPASPAVGDPSKPIDASTGNWRLWRFPFKRSGSMEVNQPALNCTRNLDAENALVSISGMDEKDESKPKVNKKKIRAITPTSEQLASLNLKEGRNAVTFTFSTPMLGKQQVDALIYLWRWDTRIVISDVDGTITKSDVLGQFMPLVGMDWSQTGVAHLFSAIKENGYQLLFLSARAISQAYHTRRFLFNLKQDGKALPDGPVVISPDGLFPSLFREVIRRAPHEFKIGCLEDIRALFPSDRNPFYAGFGNRDTDEFSYLKVGIPKGKIFIINPKGEVAVNRRVDTKSYTSLHALVNGMFPPMSSAEEEDFNSWNYWKLPPPAIRI